MRRVFIPRITHGYQARVYHTDITCSTLNEVMDVVEVDLTGEGMVWAPPVPGGGQDDDHKNGYYYAPSPCRVCRPGAPDWTGAMCRDTTLDPFNPETEIEFKALCAECPIKDECLAFAISEGYHRFRMGSEDSGIWGGTTHAERGTMIRRERWERYGREYKQNRKAITNEQQKARRNAAG